MKILTVQTEQEKDHCCIYHTLLCCESVPRVICQRLQKILTLSKTSPGFYVSTVSFENTAGIGEIAHNERFLFFPQCFKPFCDFHQI